MISTIGVEKAELYERYRLPYAREAVDELLGRVGPVRLAADVGAGTGQLARLFASRCRVVAVEPDASMLAVARAALRDLGSIALLAACAERTALAGSSVDLIVIGNAFHRFPPEACEELRRVLKPEGWIALFSYRFLDEAFTEALFPRLAAVTGLAGRIERAHHRTPVERLFGEGRTETLRYRRSHTEDWTAFFGAARAGIEAPERGEPGFAEFEAINREVFDRFVVEGMLRVDYETEVLYGQTGRIRRQDGYG